MRVKIIGAGSIGNHHAKACRTMGWDVDVVDSGLMALTRMRDEIYPQRYGKWDGLINLYDTNLQYRGGYDIIMIDTPPDVRMKLVFEALKERPRLLHLEKPICTPLLLKEPLPSFYADWHIQHPSCMVTVGYNHAVSKSIEKVIEIIKSGAIGKVITIDVEFREHWEGIFKAHPWLKGPEDSYLWYWERGGGAGGEHSHALHLWMYLAHIANFGAVAKVKSVFDMVGNYDRVAAFVLKTSNGNVGRVVQDVVTKPPRKWARIQGTKGFVEWVCNGWDNGLDGGDLVCWQTEENCEHKLEIIKTRQDDFLWLMQHYDNLLAGRAVYKDSPLHIDLGLEVMNILYNAYKG